MSMEGASRQAWRMTLETQDAVAADESLDLRAIAGDLYSVSEALAASGHLTRTLGDRTRVGWAKRELAERLLGGRISPDAMRIVNAAVSQQWRIERDLMHAIERCGHDLVLAAAQRDGNLDQVEHELVQVQEIFNKDPDLRDFLRRHDVGRHEKSDLVTKLLAGKVLPDTVWLAQRPVFNPRGRSLSAVFWQVLTLAARRRDMVTARVRSAIPLTDDQVRRLTEGLTRLYGRDIFVDATVDENLVGGVHIRVGDDVIDATIDRRLAEAGRNLSGSTAVVR